MLQGVRKLVQYLEVHNVTFNAQKKFSGKDGLKSGLIALKAYLRDLLMTKSTCSAFLLLLTTHLIHF